MPSILGSWWRVTWRQCCCSLNCQRVLSFMNFLETPIGKTQEGQKVQSYETKTSNSKNSINIYNCYKQRVPTSIEGTIRKSEWNPGPWKRSCCMSDQANFLTSKEKRKLELKLTTSVPIAVFKSDRKCWQTTEIWCIQVQKGAQENLCACSLY